MKYLFFLFVFGMAIDLNYVDTLISICTDIEIKSSTIPEYTPKRIYNCLVRGNIFLVKENDIESLILNETSTYRDSLKDYDKIFYQSAQIDVERRHKLRSMQRNIITLMLRLKHFSGLFNVPSFINLSDGRRLKKIEEYISGLNDTYTYVSTLPPVLIDFMVQTENITSASVNIDAALLVRDHESLRFVEAMNKLRTFIREQYV